MIPGLHFSGNIVHYLFICLRESIPCATAILITIWSYQDQGMEVSSLRQTSHIRCDTYTWCVIQALLLPTLLKRAFFLLFLKKGGFVISLLQNHPLGTSSSAFWAPALGHHPWPCLPPCDNAIMEQRRVIRVGHTPCRDPPSIHPQQQVRRCFKTLLTSWG